jgi:glycosyltransferase involved in cell wall biosynthesis
MIHTVPSLFEQMTDARYGWTPSLYARAQSYVDYFFTGASRAEMLSLGIPASKIIYNRCGVDIQTINAVRNARDLHYSQIRNSLGLPPDARIVLSVGRFHPSKGHLFALESLASLLPRFPNLHWVVLGEGLQRATLEAKAAELGVTCNVHLIGFRPDPLPYYAAANIYLRTPVFEAENLSSYQAMAMGLPIVGFNTGCETELVNKVGHGILVPNRDAEALAQAIAQILMLPDRGREMGERGVEYGRDHLDISQMVVPFFAAYENLANGEVAKPPDSD